MKPRRLQSATMASMVTTAAEPTGVAVGASRSCIGAAEAGVRWIAMVGTALRPIGHLAAWLVWHTMRVSLLEDLERPEPPAAG